MHAFCFKKEIVVFWILSPIEIIFKFCKISVYRYNLSICLLVIPHWTYKSQHTNNISNGFTQKKQGRLELWNALNPKSGDLVSWSFTNLFGWWNFSLLHLYILDLEHSKVLAGLVFIFTPFMKQSCFLRPLHYNECKPVKIVGPW